MRVIGHSSLATIGGALHKSFVATLLYLAFITPVVHAQTYRQIIADVDNALALKSADELVLAAGLQAEASKGKNLPSLDAHLEAVHLKDDPVMYLHFPSFPGQSTGAIPMATKSQWRGDLTLSYPLFTGFAVTAAIDKAAFEHALTALKRDDLKRNLYLQATRLYTAIYATEKILDAKEKAQMAIEEAYKKAKGLYDNGLLPPADLYNIEARKFAIDADITETKNRKSQLMNRLSYLIDRPVDSIDTLETGGNPLNKEQLIQTALASREDIRALKTSLKIDESMEKLAKSRYYPTVGVAAALKKHGDTLELNGDGYTNADQSYVGASMQWNLFSGFGDEKRVEAMRRKILAAKLALNDYQKRVRMELNNAFLNLAALQSKLTSARMETKAQEEYYRLTLGRFENQLASADELSRSIADLAAARAKVSAIKSEIFNQRATIWLMSGLESFKRAFFMKNH
ncbi:TolC family protein [Hydrogenimonas urashimensis]|uniref:TolC family protein n=1 Tax=Hydrogenimonas urashimensis TaxID=2740515 RepID=UPI001916B29D|nr:TolC family protein [Hydrogenimonas urashimensis]